MANSSSNSSLPTYEIPDNLTEDEFIEFVNKPENQIVELLEKLAAREKNFMKHIPEKFKTEQFYLEFLKQGGNLSFIPEEKRTYNVCFAGIERSDIGYIPKKFMDEEFCMKALKYVVSREHAMNCFPDDIKTEKFLIKVVNQSGLSNIPRNIQTLEVCFAAVKRKGTDICFARKDLVTYELCLAAIDADANALYVIPTEHRTYKLCLKAVKQIKPNIHPPNVLAHVPHEHLSLEMCTLAVVQNGRALQNVPYGMRTKDMCLKAVTSNGYALDDVPPELKTFEMMLAAVTNYGPAISMVNKVKDTISTVEYTQLACIAVTKIPGSIRYVVPQTVELAQYALSRDPSLITFIDDKILKQIDINVNIKGRKENYIRFEKTDQKPTFMRTWLSPTELVKAQNFDAITVENINQIEMDKIDATYIVHNNETNIFEIYQVKQNSVVQKGWIYGEYVENTSELVKLGTYEVCDF